MNQSLSAFLDESLNTDRSALGNALLRTSSIAKKLEASLKAGDLSGAESAVRQLSEAVGPIAVLVKTIEDQLNTFNLEQYLENNFHEDLVAACKKEEIYLEGTFPKYEVFPFHVEIVPTQKLAVINFKKVRSMRPNILATIIKKEKDALEKAPFNAESFLYAIYTSYDLLVSRVRMKTGVTDDISVPLKDVYKTLVLLPRWQRDYPLRSFAFDLYRLLKSDTNEIAGCLLELGSVRERANAIRILDQSGREQLYGRIQFRRR